MKIEENALFAVNLVRMPTGDYICFIIYFTVGKTMLEFYGYVRFDSYTGYNVTFLTQNAVKLSNM